MEKANCALSNIVKATDSNYHIRVHQKLTVYDNATLIIVENKTEINHLKLSNFYLQPC